MNGVIWSKTKKTFVPISSVPIFAMMQEERLEKSRALETKNFQLQNLTVTSFQEPYFFEFYDNDMKVTGLCGELWTLLSQKLNFTLQLVRSNENRLGVPEKNFRHGLLSIISRNETIAIPKVEMFGSRLLMTDFTMPLWMNTQGYYFQDEVIHDSAWIAKVFSWEMWCCILLTYLLLNLCSFWSQTVLSRIGNNCKRTTISDHIFYNFGMICNQNHIPDVLIGRPRMLEISQSLFCSILSMLLGAIVYIYIAKRIRISPSFYDLDSMLSDTTYDVVCLKGSTGDIMFQVADGKDYIQARTTKRIIIASTVEEMLKYACMKGKKKYAIFQDENEYKTRRQIECYLIPIGKPIIKMWVASGIVKNFKYKRTIDLGILRLKEIGLWNALINRWLAGEDQNYDNVIAEAIEFDQIFLLVLLMCCGAIIAIIILIIENIVYSCKHKSA